jgi:hypothetical protein
MVNAIDEVNRQLVIRGLVYATLSGWKRELAMTFPQCVIGTTPAPILN